MHPDLPNFCPDEKGKCNLEFFFWHMLDDSDCHENDITRSVILHEFNLQQKTPNIMAPVLTL